MFWLTPYIQKIEALSMAGDDASLTYAALEARLGIERVCYERLKVAHPYISPDDVRSWRPHHVIQTLIEEVDPSVVTAHEFQIQHKGEYVTLGKQAGFDIKYLSHLWHSLGSFLHSELPKGRDAEFAHYKPAKNTKAKVGETLEELKRLSEGTLMSTQIWTKVRFECRCGQENVRAADHLKHLSVLNCYRQDCDEQYIALKQNGKFIFERRTAEFTCAECKQPVFSPYKHLTKFPLQQVLGVKCHCGARNLVMWRLCQESGEHYAERTKKAEASES